MNKPHIGCYIDGANQNQMEGDARAVRLSESFGRVLDRETAKFCQRVDHDVTTDRDDELSSGFSDEAADWLNDNASLTYAFWGWEDGNFGLWPNLDCAKEMCDFVSHKHLSKHTDPDDPSYPPEDFEGEWLHVNDHGNAALYVRENGKDTEIWSVV